MPTTRRLTTAAAALALACAPLALATPAHANPAHASFNSHICQFSDGSTAEIDVYWYDGGQSVLEQIYRTHKGLGDMEVVLNRKGASRGYGGFPVTEYLTGDGPLQVQIDLNLGAQCPWRIS